MLDKLKTIIVCAWLNAAPQVMVHAPADSLWMAAGLGAFFGIIIALSEKESLATSPDML